MVSDDKEMEPFFKKCFLLESFGLSMTNEMHGKIQYEVILYEFLLHTVPAFGKAGVICFL